MSFRFSISAFRYATKVGSVTMRAWRRADQTCCLRRHKVVGDLRHVRVMIAIPVRCREFVGLGMWIPEIWTVGVSVTCSGNREFPAALLWRSGRAPLPMHRCAGAWLRRRDRSFVRVAPDYFPPARPHKVSATSAPPHPSCLVPCVAAYVRS
jgi:hypothetical protein